MTVNIYRATAEDTLDLPELRLYHEIIAHRATRGLPALPLSRALTTTAGRHVVDTRENIWAEDLVLPPGTNLHSWSDAPYFADGRNPEVMWFAPLRLGTGYLSAGYEISAAGYETGTLALEGWKASPPHRAVLDSSGIWAATPFAAIGVGLETAPGASIYRGRVAHVWFGEVPDPTGPPVLVGTAGVDVIVATAFADIVTALGGADRIMGGGGDDRLSGGAGPDVLHGGIGNDVLNGGPGADQHYGGGGADVLYGGAGPDRLSGGPSPDQLAGGPGRDWMAGGPGADLFRFAAPGHAGLGVSRDLIADFLPAIDRIDLSLIDARPDLPGDQVFVFLDAVAPTGVPGSLTYGGGVVSADVNGDALPDFQITLAGAPAIAGGDFLL